MSTISIPPLIKLPRNIEQDECGCSIPVIHVRTIQFSTKNILQLSHRSYILSNENPLTILSNSSQTVGFPSLFITSLPALCILTVDPFLHRYNLSHNINIVPTNDTYPHVTLFNYTKKSITIEPNHLTVFCQIVLTGNQKYFLHS